MSIRELPAHPNLEHLKTQARTLLRQGLGSDASATARFVAFGITAAAPKLADALHVIAREYGFDTWPYLKLHIDVASEGPAEGLQPPSEPTTLPLSAMSWLITRLSNPASMSRCRTTASIRRPSLQLSRKRTAKSSMRCS